MGREKGSLSAVKIAITWHAKTDRLSAPTFVPRREEEGHTRSVRFPATPQMWGEGRCWEVDEGWWW